MRILHVVPTYYPATRYGGPIRSVHGLARAQAQLGHDVHVATTSVDGPGDSPVPLGRPVDVDGVQVWYFRSPFLRRLYWSPAMARFHRQRACDFDVVHLHSVYLWPTSHAARTADRAGVPYVLSPRGMLDRELIRRRSPVVKTAWIQLVERRTLERAALVHFTSRVEEQACLNLGLRPRRSVCVPNGLDRADIADAPPAPHRQPYALYLGRVNWKKGIDLLLEAMARVPALRLVVAGNDDEGLTPGLERRAADLGIRTRVDFMGPVLGEQKWALLRGAACFVLPSCSENFGNVVLEALAADCPVIVTPEVGIAEYLPHAASVVARDPAALAAAMSRLHEDADARARQRQQARRLLDERFSWEAIAKTMAAAYASAASQRPAA